MPPRNETPNRNKTFGRLLSGAINSIATYEGKTAPIVEEELGQALHLAGKTIQRYKAGSLPPEERTIETLAEAAIQRGYLGREWLERFLHAARYPFAEQLLDQLCPAGPARVRPPRVYENLPAPTYSQFVMRPQAFAEVLDGLQQRSAAVLIVGLGGNGKTSLAREVAAHCLRDSADAPRFDAVVWVSDKDRPGTTNLSTVLDEIARTLDYPGFTQFAHDEKLYEVGQLLKRQRVLLVIDNFETISDGALLTWLLRLPEPSKAIMTSREFRREMRSSWPVELRGMSEAEAWELLTERVRVLKIERIAGDRTQLEPLLAATGGNPKALTMMMGLLKYERRPLQHVVDDLYAARGDLFDDLFARAWALLDEAARRVLLVATFFPTSATAEALSASADAQGFAFDRAVERLADLALLDVQQEDLRCAPRYTLHSLVRAFARARLAGAPELEAYARERWATYVTTTATALRQANQYIDLDFLEDQDLAGRSYLDWSHRQQRWPQFIAIYRLFHSLWSIRGYFDARGAYAPRAIQAAQAAGDLDMHITLLASQARLESYYGNLATARELLHQLEILRQNNDQAELIYQRSYVVSTPAILAYYAGDVHGAAQMLARELGHGGHSQRGIQRLQILLARCYLALDDTDAAQSLLSKLFNATAPSPSLRIAGRAATYLARLAIHDGDAERGDELIQQSQVYASRTKDRRIIAELHVTESRLYTLRGDLPAARNALAEAIDLFERLGMRRELAEARSELQRLTERGASVT
jgi:hypothetical protein